MRPPEHILVIADPDGGDRQSAIDKALVIAQSCHASVDLLICTIAPRRKATTSSADHSAALLETLAAPLRERGIDVSARQVAGECLHDMILDYLRGSKATLVVKELHRHSFIRRTILDDTDWHLARDCPVALLLTRSRAWPKVPQVMAAIDPQAGRVGAATFNRKLIRRAASLAITLHGTLHVLHAYLPQGLTLPVGADLPEPSAEVSRELECESSFMQSQIEAFARMSGVTSVSIHVEMGLPDERLLTSVQQLAIDVLVIGASSHGRWHRIIVGSTTSTALESLPCDLLVERPDVEA